jgi:hypothetical protein
VSGVQHDSTPTGKIETIGGVRSYFVMPSVEHPKDKVLLFLTDVFGLDLINAQVRLRSASNGGEKLKSAWGVPGGRLRGERIQGGQRPVTRVEVGFASADDRSRLSARRCDPSRRYGSRRRLFSDVHLCVSGLTSGAAELCDISAWFKTHGPADTRPHLDAVITALRAEGVSPFGVTSY